MDELATPDMSDFTKGAPPRDFGNVYRPSSLEECIFNADTVVPIVAELNPVSLNLSIGSFGVIFANMRWYWAPEGLCQAQCVVYPNRQVHVYFVHTPYGQLGKHIPEEVAELIFKTWI